MPIIDTKPSNPPQEPINPNIRPKEYRGITVDSKYTPRRSLLTHISGFPWLVEYYSQYVNADNALAGQNVTRHAVYQQYLRIKDFEIMVSTPQSSTQDLQSKEMMVTGSATTYPGFIPNDKDAFIATGRDGRRYLYEIKNVEQAEITKDTCYTFEFFMVSFDDQERIADLNSKVQKDTVYVKDFVYTNQRPFLVDDENTFHLKARQFIMDSQDRYMKDYVHRTFKTFMVPGQTLTVYDPYLASAVLKLIDGSEHPKKQFIMLQSVDTAYPYEIYTLWEGILTCNGANRSSWATQLGRIDSFDFPDQPSYGSIRYSGIEQVYHALGNADYIGTLPDYDHHMVGLAGSPLDDVKMLALQQPVLSTELLSGTVLQGLELPNNVVEGPDAVLYRSVAVDNYYVFSEAFYRKSKGQSILESEVNKLLDGITLTRPHLLNLMESSARWNRLDRFYYLPVLWVLLRVALTELT